MTVTLGPRLGLMLNAAAGDAHPNEFRAFLRGMDALSQMSVKSRTVAAQPASPSNGDTYILPASATGTDWGGKAVGTIAYYTTQKTTTSGGVETTTVGWDFITPRYGFRCFVEDEAGRAYVYTTAWAVDTPYAFESRTLSTLPTGANGREIFVTDALSPIWEGVVCDGSATVYRPSPWVPPSGAILTLETWEGRQRLYATARTNFLTYSDQLNNPAWTKSGAGVGSAPVVTPDYAAAPDGATTADRVIYALNGGSTTSDRSDLYQPIGLTGDLSPRRVSCWVRSTDGVSTYTLRLEGTSGSGSVISVVGSWQRQWINIAPSSGALAFYLRARGSLTSDSADVLVSRCQYENGTVVTSSIQTTSAATPVTDYSVDATTGAVTLASAPPAGARLQWNVLGGKAAYYAGAWRRSNGTIID